ncbi:MAG: esterase [Gammaproteobacteria bacterium]|nr:esterase [Gammaproteobacteria bacterium]
MSKYWITAICVLLAACSAEKPPEPEIDWSKETPVDPDSIAGDHHGISGTVVYHRNFPSKFVAARDIEIWLPPSYQNAPEKRYPVVYMHDGQNVFDPSASKYSGWDWGVDEAMSNMIESGAIREAIIVAPHSLDEWRNQDYFPQKAGEMYAKEIQQEWPEFKPDELRADGYLKFLTSELKSFVDLNYRTLTDAENTSIMGSSMGGLISLYAICEYPDVYGAAGNVSTHFPLADGKLIEYFASRLPDPKNHRLYFDYGTWTLDHNYEEYQDLMDAALEKAGYTRGVNWTTRKFVEHDHSERSWRNRVHIPLKILLDGKFVVGGIEK